MKPRWVIGLVSLAGVAAGFAVTAYAGGQPPPAQVSDSAKVQQLHRIHVALHNREQELQFLLALSEQGAGPVDVAASPPSVSTSPPRSVWTSPPRSVSVAPSPEPVSAPVTVTPDVPVEPSTVDTAPSEPTSASTAPPSTDSSTPTTATRRSEPDEGSGGGD